MNTLAKSTVAASAACAAVAAAALFSGQLTADAVRHPSPAPTPERTVSADAGPVGRADPASSRTYDHDNWSNRIPSLGEPSRHVDQLPARAADFAADMDLVVKAARLALQNNGNRYYVVPAKDNKICVLAVLGDTDALNCVPPKAFEAGEMVAAYRLPSGTWEAFGAAPSEYQSVRYGADRQSFGDNVFGFAVPASVKTVTLVGDNAEKTVDLPVE